uniref:Uncharacterized protein n=1 Tax=Amphimedon queenslandica TaxID=400682 RepID=A0A1X7VBX3_AMPQE
MAFDPTILCTLVIWNPARTPKNYTLFSADKCNILMYMYLFPHIGGGFSIKCMMPIPKVCSNKYSWF